MDALDRLKIIFPNLVYRSTLSGGRWQAGDLSLDALLDRVMGHVARSVNTDPADTWLTVRLDRARSVGGLAALNHNLSPSAQIVLQGFRDEALTDCVHNPGGEAVDVFERVYRRGAIPFGEPNWWTLKPLREDIGRVTTIALVLLPKPRIARFWRVRFVDPGNPSRHLDIGKVFLGPLFDPSHNYAFGANLSVIDESRMSQSVGGTRYYDERGKRRRFAFGFNNLDESREFGRLFDLTADAGITRDLVVIPEPADRVNLQRRSFCAAMREPSALEQAMLDTINTSFILEEDL